MTDPVQFKVLSFDKKEVSDEPKINEGLVLILKELLSRAEAGELSGIAYCTTSNDPERLVGTGWDSDAPFTVLVTGVSVLHKRIMEAIGGSN